MKKLLLLRPSKLMGIPIMLFILLSLSTSVMSQTSVKNVVLVHGAFADGSGWEGVYKILKKKGYNVSVVGNPNTGFADDVAATKRVLDRQDGPTILVGHSYGGAIITEAGNHSKVAGLVYIAAFAPDANGFIWYDTKKYHSGFCADLSKEQAEFLADSQIPVSASVFGATIANPAWKTKKSWYVVAQEDQTIPPDGERFMAKRAGATITEVKASHLVFMSKPQSVADVIETAAKASIK